MEIIVTEKLFSLHIIGTAIVYSVDVTFAAVSAMVFRDEISFYLFNFLDRDTNR